MLVGALALLPALASALPAGAQPAAQVPLGTYLASCREAVLLPQGTLIASCAGWGGYYVPARLEDVAFCVGDIENRAGRLFCTRMLTVLGIQTPAARAAPQKPPAGSYMGSCRAIRLEDGWLKATCANAAGRWAQTSILANWCATLRRDIVNIDGQLSCSF